MAKNIHYVTCPKCKGEFYVTRSFFESKDTMCYCPFCKSEFSPVERSATGAGKKVKLSALAALWILIQGGLPFLLTGLLVVISPTARAEAASTYPSQPITFVVGMAAGGITDMAARTLGEESKKILKQEVMVVNKVGASQTVAMSSVISAPPDGYTLGATTDAPLVRAAHMMALNFDPLADTRPIIQYGNFISVFVVPADSPFKTIKDAIDFAGKNPGKLTYGTPGIGTTPYLCVAGYGLQQGLKISFVPFPGDSAVVTALLGKHIMMGGMGIASMMNQYKAGQLRIIGIIEGEERLDAFPQLPTLYEMGMQGALPPPSLQIFGQKALPDSIVKKLEDTFLKAIETPGWKKFAAENEIYPVKKAATGPELLRNLKNVSDRSGSLIKSLGLAPGKPQ
jgi:tripartite-type tricarboxylate transporter receptor subunit TctC